MIFYKFDVPLNAIKRFGLALVSVLMFWSLAQAPMLAARDTTILPKAETSLEALSSENMSPEEINRQKAQRRQVQSMRSEAADTEKEADSLGEVLSEKLNLREIKDTLTNDEPEASAADSMRLSTP
ncbi:hypothetical protein PN498_26915 [Oscillatoria sp. CS-180]|uniref:hypothetical protein n=1 Tax=Oscillatoria sp. CS-180 TaxID=3021720 RepID=UPI00232E06D3|nr:hypothetical protein [Oscillatoria sp. CS-180]MDB9529649.1 hypothetical protein [Oscillatoria sp. CS-180]